MEKSIYDLELNEEIYIDGGSRSVVRVPGGWIYNYKVSETVGDRISTSISSVFVPYNDEFLNTDEEEDVKVNINLPK